jgi:hypothetical protein
MNGLNPIRHLVRWSICGLAVVLIGGCCGPVIRSQRFTETELDQVMACDAAIDSGDVCECRNVLDHFFVFARAPHALLPGAIADRRGFVPVQPDEAAQNVPHSKFHPVPTRPVFAARDVGSRLAPSEPPPIQAEMSPAPIVEAPPMELELIPSETVPTPLEPTLPEPESIVPKVPPSAEPEVIKPDTAHM